MFSVKGKSLSYAAPTASARSSLLIRRSASCIFLTRRELCFDPLQIWRSLNANSFGGFGAWKRSSFMDNGSPSWSPKSPASSMDKHLQRAVMLDGLRTEQESSVFSLSPMATSFCTSCSLSLISSSVGSSLSGLGVLRAESSSFSASMCSSSIFSKTDVLDMTSSFSWTSTESDENPQMYIYLKILCMHFKHCNN